MNEVALGITLPQFVDDPSVYVRAAADAEAEGLDSVWAFDHLWPLSGGKRRPALEAWTTLGWLARATGKVAFGPLVTRSSLRHPVLLAKMSATVAAIAPGRLIVAIGSGDALSRNENEAFGIDYFSGGDRIDQLRSTVETVVNYLRPGTVDLHDDFVDLDGLPPSPVPHEPPPVWVGGRAGETLEVAGTLADGWNGWGGSPKRFAQDAQTVLDVAGDRPLQLSWGGLVVLASDDAAARRALGDRNPGGYLVGGPATVARALGEYAEAGARHLVVTLVGPYDPAAVARLGREVLPALRESF